MSTSRRIQLLDLLRGFVIVWMALDHTRDFFQPSGLNPTDLTTTTPLFFATRWITHLCAPTFVLLAGVGMGMQVQRKGMSRDLMRFFITRGLWLMLLEVTWVSFSWYFSFEQTHLGVLWGIGGAMVLVAPLCLLPLRTVGAIGVVGTVLLAMWTLPAGGAERFLFGPMSLELWGHKVFSTYVIIPWAAVLAMGVGLVELFTADTSARRVGWTGAGLLVAFFALRMLNWGDPLDWSTQNVDHTIAWLSTFHVSKYPPSLAYLCATLGTAFVGAAMLPRLPERARNALAVFGKVPLFFYLLHLPVLHLAGMVHAWARFDATRIPSSEPLSLPLVYGVWLGVSALLWWPCARYARIKHTQRRPWMRYL